MRLKDYTIRAAREEPLNDLEAVTLTNLGSERLGTILADEDDQPNEALVAAARRHRMFASR